MKPLDKRVLEAFRQLSEALCNDVTEPSSRERQRNSLYGTMKGYFDTFVDAAEAELRRMPKKQEPRYS